MIKNALSLFLVLLAGLLGACSASISGIGDTVVVNAYVDGKGVTGVSGRIVAKGDDSPIPGAYVNIYPDATSNLLGPSQYISTPSDSEGRYTIDVPPGTYYVVARKRMSGLSSGPLAPGDLFSEHQRVRTTVVEGKLAVVDLPLAPMKAPMFFKKSTIETRTDTGIRGRLVDSDGKPVPGSFAVVYENSDIKRLPDYASTLSDGKGEFVVYLPKGGTYYMSARIHAWDMPRPGELYGKFGSEEAEPIQVAEGGFVEGVEIVLTPFAGAYKEGKSRRPY